MDCFTEITCDIENVQCEVEVSTATPDCAAAIATASPSTPLDHPLISSLQANVV
jgi:hypothetical protein